MTQRVSGWILPDGTWFECPPWAHIKAAKEHPWVQTQRTQNVELNAWWHHPDDEQLRACLARLGMVKVCYHLIDADNLTSRQLRTLQQIHALTPLETELEFIGRIRARLELRILMKMRDAERLNRLGDFG